jgi:hypothetical protein
MPDAEALAVADRSYASLKLLEHCRKLRRPITFVTRLRLDAALYERVPLCAVPGKEGGPASRANACPTFRWWSKIRAPFGSSPPSLAGTVKASGWSNSLQRRPCGIAPACSQCVCAGFWCAIRRGNSRPRPSCVPTLRPIRRRSSLGLSCAGRWKRPSKKCVVGDGDTENHTGAFGAVFVGHIVCAPPDDTGSGCFSAGGLVPQDSPHVRRRFGVGSKGAVGICDFSWVACRRRDGKSRAGVHGTFNRCALLCSLMAKVEL